ncbi:MAG: AMP-binding protein [Hyphomicrobiales bacterium]
MTTLIDAFDEAVLAHGQRPAIIEGSGKSASFEDLDQLGRAFAAGFEARGIGPGDRVLVAMPVSIALYACLAALWRLGAVVVFPEPAMGLKGLRHAVQITQPKAFLASGWYRRLGWLLPELRRLPLRLAPRATEGQWSDTYRVEPDEPALISFTSGSTGAPKAIARSHTFMMTQNEAIRSLLDPESEAARDLVAFPVFVLVCLSLGITSVLPAWKLSQHDRVSAETIHQQIERFGVTRLLVPPVICETLSQADSLPALDAVFTGGGPVFPDTLARLASLQPRLRMVSVYGSTEAEPIAHLEYGSMSTDDLESMKTGGGLLAGKPVAPMDVRLEDREILVAGAHVNESYLDTSQNADSKVQREGRVWHRTGDAGRFDEQGRLWLLGRHNAQVAGVDPFAVETAARFWSGAKRSALAEVDGRPVLVVSGDKRNLQQWREAAKTLGLEDVRYLQAIPLDSRHRSKTDYRALKRMLKIPG